MSVVTVRPDGTVALTGGGSVVGAANAHSALNDNSDSSYLSYPAPAHAAVTLANPTVPAGAVLKAFAVRVRAACESAGGVMLFVATSEDGDPLLGSTFTPVAWLSPTTFTALIGTLDPDVDTTALQVDLDLAGAGPVLRIYEAYFDLTVVEQPVINVTAPLDPVDDTNLPVIEWSITSLDSDGGGQSTFEAKVFTAAQYGAGGFDPDTSDPLIESGQTSSSDTSWQAAEGIPDGVYRAYVRVAQTVNGDLHWSEWDYIQFEVDVPLPDPPAVTLHGSADGGGIEIFLEAAGAVTTDVFELQRSDDDGATWSVVRTELGDGLIAPDVDEALLWDFEAPNGEIVTYRARALHDYGAYAASAWTEETGSWTSNQQWLKFPSHEFTVEGEEGGEGGGTYGGGTYGGGTYGSSGGGTTLITRNLRVRVDKYPGHQRDSRQGVFQPLGRTRPVVVSDTRGPARGTVVLLVDDDADRDTLDELLDTGVPLLLQMGATDQRPDRWVVFAQHDRVAIADKAFVAATFETLAWTEVERPD